jgi:hypothetical protein
VIQNIVLNKHFVLRGKQGRHKRKLHARSSIIVFFAKYHDQEIKENDMGKE